jgi:hypothetical protein
VCGCICSPSVLGRRSVAQLRVAVSVVELALEVADDHAGLEKGVPVITAEAFLTQTVVERLHLPR